MSSDVHPVHAAAATSAGQLGELIDKSPKLRDEPGVFGRHPIHSAAEAGRLDCVDLLLKCGASPNATENLYGQTPLHFAVDADSLACVTRLLDAGAHVNYVDARGETPIFYCRSRAVIELLKQRRANLKIRSARGQYPVEYCAAYKRAFDVLEFWVEQGVDFAHVPDFAWPVVGAIACGPGQEGDHENDVRMLTLLLEHGADANLCDNDKTPPIVGACQFRPHLAKPLLLAGADPNRRNRAGQTALHAAVSRGDPELVSLLLQHGADVNAADLYHQTPYDLAADSPAVQELLAPDYRPHAWPVPTADQVIERLRAIPSYRDVEFKGCTSAEIDGLERELDVRFPRSYHDFLARMGKGAGDFLKSDHWYFMAEDVPDMAHEDEDSAFRNLPDNYFVFAHRMGETFMFFVADGTSDDPPVFILNEGSDGVYYEFGRSVWEFVDKLVADYERWSG